MFKEDFYKERRVSSGFGEDRGRYKHSGIDYPGTKKEDIFNQINGKVFKILHEKDYFGTQCIVYSNPKFAGGVNDKLYHSYCHLYKVSVKEDQFVEAGSILGKMGNSGGSYTSFDKKGKYTAICRKVTKEEQEDKNCNFGVHLHLWFYQDCKPGKTTPLFNKLKGLNIISKQSLGDTHFYQWSKLIIAPRVIYKYFKILNES